MEKRDLGVQPDYVERAFKVAEVFVVAANAEARAYFFDRALQLADLDHIQANRPLRRPGKPGWRFVASPHSLARIAQRAAMFQKRLEAEYSSLESAPDKYGKFPRGYVR